MTGTDPVSEEVIMRYREIAEASDKLIRAMKAEARAEGVAEGEARGEARGEVRGALEAARTALLAIFTGRALTVDATTEARIAECKDAAVLQPWIARAVTATSADVVFVERPAR